MKILWKNDNSGPPSIHKISQKTLGIMCEKIGSFGPCIIRLYKFGPLIDLKLHNRILYTSPKFIKQTQHKPITTAGPITQQAHHNQTRPNLLIPTRRSNPQIAQVKHLIKKIPAPFLLCIPPLYLPCTSPYYQSFSPKIPSTRI